MNAKTSFTPGPWKKSEEDRYFITVSDADGEFVTRLAKSRYCDERNDPECEANNELMIAAPDHTLIARAMCIGAGRWEPWGDGRGEFCMNGPRHATKLDEFGVPVVTSGMRAALAKATQP